MKKRYQQQPQLWPEKQRERVKVMCEVSSIESVSLSENPVLTSLQWNTVNTVTNGPWKFGCINGVGSNFMMA